MSFSILVSLGLMLLAYLLGSIPTGYLVGRILKDIDIREYGSGSTGATNVLRTVGKGAAITVLTVDLLKGVMAVYIVKLAYLYLPTEWVSPNAQDWLIVMASMIAVVGHSKSIWLNFTGGKSVATSLGILLAMTPVVGLVTLAVFLIVLGTSRIVSLSSVSAAIAVNVLMYLINPTFPYLVFTFVAGLYVIIRHRNNIQRLLAGTEPRIGQTV
jgi:glycerol-3-phosphate acyltransferase PlsY